MQRIQRIAVQNLISRVKMWECGVRVGGIDYSFPFRDLVEFSNGVQDLLGIVERLVPRGELRPKDRQHLQLEGLRVQDAAEHNRNLYSARDVREMRAEGEKVCGGDWYMEVSINGTDSDLSFSTLTELFQLVQQIIARELGTHGVIVPPAPVEVARA